MEKALKNFLIFYQKRDKVIFWSICVCLFCAFFISLLWGINLGNLPSQIPLFYSLTWGEPQLVSLGQFLILPSLILLVTLINLIISLNLHPSQLILKRMLLLSSATVSVLLLITAVKIVYIFV